MPHQETKVQRHELSGDDARWFDIEHLEELIVGDAVPTKLPKGKKDAKDDRRSRARAELIKKQLGPYGSV